MTETCKHNTAYSLTKKRVPTFLDSVSFPRVIIADKATDKGNTSIGVSVL
jgi:hypothetical protein